MGTMVFYLIFLTIILLLYIFLYVVACVLLKKIYNNNIVCKKN